MIGFIVAGPVIGALARLLLPGRERIGLGLTVVLGVLGSSIGGIVASVIGSGDSFEPNLIGFIVAVLTSVCLLAVAERAVIGGGHGRRRLEP